MPLPQVLSRVGEHFQPPPPRVPGVRGQLQTGRMGWVHAFGNRVQSWKSGAARCKPDVLEDWIGSRLSLMRPEQSNNTRPIRPLPSSPATAFLDAGTHDILLDPAFPKHGIHLTLPQ
jgi:hypothetical protein